MSSKISIKKNEKKKKIKQIVKFLNLFCQCTEPLLEHQYLSLRSQQLLMDIFKAMTRRDILPENDSRFCVQHNGVCLLLYKDVKKYHQVYRVPYFCSQPTVQLDTFGNSKTLREPCFMWITVRLKRLHLQLSTKQASDRSGIRVSMVLHLASLHLLMVTKLSTHKTFLSDHLASNKIRLTLLYIIPK